MPVDDFAEEPETAPLVSSRPVRVADFESLGLELAIGRGAGGEPVLELRPRADLQQPDLLLYWLPRESLEGAPAGVPEGALLLGALAGARVRRFVLPERALVEQGALLLYTLAHQRRLAMGALELADEDWRARALGRSER